MITKNNFFEFEWDKGNIDKNKTKHAVENYEAEEVFFDDGKVVLKDKMHSSEKEDRYIILGKTRKERLLYIVFTKRGKKLRVISARDINSKERYLYEKTT